MDLPTSPRVIDRIMVDWHEHWKHVMNDDRNRKFMAGADLKVLSLSSSSWIGLVAGDRGYIIQRFPNDQEAVHYMAFACCQNTNNMMVFDPAGPGSPYEDPGLERKMNRKTTWNVMLCPLSPQISPNDNFCQTWSLAWLLVNWYEDQIKGCWEYMRRNINSAEAEDLEFSCMASICNQLVRDYQYLPEQKEHWNYCKRHMFTVFTNFEKFQHTSPRYRADTERRELWPEEKLRRRS